MLVRDLLLSLATAGLHHAQELVAIHAIKKMRARWKKPERSAADLIAALETPGMPLTAAHLKQAVALI
jgi:hypothetical protein